MSATTAEQIVDRVVAVLGAVDGTGVYDTDLRGKVFAADQITPVSMNATPLVLIGYDSIDPATGLRERTMTVAVDVFVDADYASTRGLAVRALLLRIRRDIEVALHAVRYSESLLRHQRLSGAALNQPEAGATRNSLTMRFAITFTEERAA